jgi:CheY-like chemotaxis protein/HPt (histidine-containing phosphotransfer) domain-containing protein
MGGRMEVKSEPGVGSTFSLCLPLEAVDKADLVISTPVQAESFAPDLLNGKRVLLVEDVPLNRFLVDEMTKDWGLVLEMAMDGSAGLQKASENNYDLILMDIQMPVMDGVEATRAIRKLDDPVRASVPIVALSANAFDSDRRHYLAVGMNDTLSKPFDALQLRQLLERVWQSDQKQVQPTEKESVGNTLELKIDLAYLNRVGNGNQVFVETMLKSFVESVAEIGLEMDRMLVAGDRKGIGEAAHKLKFALGVVGITALKDIEAMLEKQGKGNEEPIAEREYSLIVTRFIQDMRGLREEVLKRWKMGDRSLR